MKDVKEANRSNGFPLEKKITSPTPSYHEQAPDLTASFANLHLPDLPPSNGAPPGTPEVIAHLKLLSAISNLKEETGTTRGLFGLAIKNDKDEQTDGELLAKVREKRWAVYVARAVDRFEVWWKSVIIGDSDEAASERRITQVHMQDEAWYPNWPTKARPRTFNKDLLPPLGKSSSPIALKNMG
jgi:hypothetical protein